MKEKNDKLPTLLKKSFKFLFSDSVKENEKDKLQNWERIFSRHMFNQRLFCKIFLKAIKIQHVEKNTI